MTGPRATLGVELRLVVVPATSLPEFLRDAPGYLPAVADLV